MTRLDGWRRALVVAGVIVLLDQVTKALIDAAVRHGMTPSTAAKLAVQTMAGAADVMAEAGNDPVALRRRVTSPGGATARGLEALEEHGVRAAFADAVTAAVELSR